MIPNAAHHLLPTTMTRCRPSPRFGLFRPSPVVLDALAAFDIDCECKSSLIVLCAVGAESGCRERRRDGICGCRPRYLPTCILDTADGRGCPSWREGKTCRCPWMYMPRCLVVGCAVRRRGQRCECPRTPTEVCPHVRAKIEQYATLTFASAAAKANTWAELLWALLPEDYRDRPESDCGYPTPSHEEAVNLMMLREKLKLSLWHRGDVRELVNGGLSQQRQMRRQAAGLQRLLRAVAPVSERTGGAA